MQQNAICRATASTATSSIGRSTQDGLAAENAQTKARRSKRPSNPLLADRAALSRAVLDALSQHAPIGKTALSRLLNIGLRVVTEKLEALEAEGQAERFRRSGRRGRLDEFWQPKGQTDVDGEMPAAPRRLSTGLSPAETLDAFRRAARQQFDVRRQDARPSHHMG